MIKAEEREKRKEKRFLCFLSSFLFLLSSKFSKKHDLRSINLNVGYKSLTSLIILLTKPVDKSVDKLWISCG